MKEAPDSRIVSLLRQLASYTRHQGASVHSKRPKRFPGTWDITVEGNSSFLNELTTEIASILPVIANDIDPHHKEVMDVATDIISQLADQIVDWNSVPTVLPDRAGRELGQRISGESSFVQIKEELRIHKTRIKGNLSKYRSAKGPTAWHQRDTLRLPIRIDSLALLSTARRLRRIASDLAKRVPNDHLDAAINNFDQATPNLILLRNIAEHIDEYSIGRGKRDTRNTEPAEVFYIAIEDEDVSITARSQTLKMLAAHEACLSLINCLSAFKDHYALFHLLPMFADFDFGTYDGQRFVPVARDSETVEQSQQRALMNEARSKMQSEFKLPEEWCPECGRQL